jgi:hypothetical protein
LTRNPIREKENITLSSKRQGIHRETRQNQQPKQNHQSPAIQKVGTHQKKPTAHLEESSQQCNAPRSSKRSATIHRINNQTIHLKPDHPKSRHPQKTKKQPSQIVSRARPNKIRYPNESGESHSDLLQKNQKMIYNNLTMLPRLKLQDSRCKPTKNKHHWRDDIMISKSTTTTKTPTKQHQQQQTKHMAVLLLFKGPWNVRRIYGYGRMPERTGER